MSNKPYNPLEKRHLAESIQRAILESTPQSLSRTSHLVGAGVYIIYYTGDLAWYAPVAAKNASGRLEQPIYVGKAIPKGGRKGGLAEDTSLKSLALRDRLGHHHSSIAAAINLDVNDFSYRSLIVDDIWIPLGENMLIEEFKPVWNRVVDGFGNKDPGTRRKDQYRSPWDVIHPGRKFADKLGDNPRTSKDILDDVAAYFATGKVPKRKARGPKGDEPFSADEEES